MRFWPRFLSPIGTDVDRAVQSAQTAFPAWRETPPADRIQFLFRLKNALEANFEDIARITTAENGKTLAEARAELRRGIENVEVACGIPTLMQGYNLEDVARGIDETMIRQPLGVVAIVTPFNFPAMIPLWFLPYAIACGNTLVMKPSERVPLTVRRIFELLEETGLPKGVANLVTGGKDAVDALLDHPAVRAISFVGSTPVARYIYARGAQNGKRVQCQGGAKNHVVVMPDADFETSAKIIADSAFGCAGQRCLAVSVAIAVKDAAKPFQEALIDVASRIRVGNGLDADVDMGPVISQASKTRIEGLIQTGIEEGGKTVLGGKPSGNGSGSYVPPTILAGVGRNSSLAENEIFGPVLALQTADDLDDAIALLAKNRYGNASSIFTSSGAAAQVPLLVTHWKYRREYRSWRRRWPTSRSADGKIVSWECCTARVVMQSNSIPTKK